MKNLFVILIFTAILISGCTKDNSVVPDDPNGNITDPPPAKEIVFRLQVENCSEFSYCSAAALITKDGDQFPFMGLNNINPNADTQKLSGTDAENISGKLCRVDVESTLAEEGLSIFGLPDPNHFYVTPTIGDTVTLAIKIYKGQ